MLTPAEQQTRAMYENTAFAERYANYFSDYDEHFFRFQELLPQGRILDLGCGPAYDGNLFAAWNYNYIGVDFAYAILCAGREWHEKNILLAQMDMAHLGFITDAFDGFWAVSSLMHIPKCKIEYAIQEIHRVVKSGGIGHMLLRKGNFELMQFNPIAKMDALVSAYLPDDFSTLLKKNGFEILDFEEYTMSKDMQSMMYFVKNH